MGIHHTIYLDYAAATPLDKRVFAAMEPYFTEKFYNPSSPYEPARQVGRDIEDARMSISHILGAKPSEITFTAGATESINLIFKSVAHAGSAVVAATEHHAVMEAAHSTDLRILGVDQKGRVAVDDLTNLIDDKTAIVSIALGNNEIGTLQRIKQLSVAIKKIKEDRMMRGNKTPLIFHTDASQGAGLVDIHVARLGVDAMTLNAGKIYGPKQTGLLWASSDVQLSPIIVGGGQENGLRSGTENVASIIGFARALTIAEEKRKSENDRLQKLRKDFIKRVVDAFPEVIISGDQKHSLAHIVHLSFPGLDAERVLFALESEGIYVATGAACAANKQRASHVLRAIGMSDEDIGGSLRFSFGRQTTEQELERVVEVLKSTVDRERQIS